MKRIATFALLSALIGAGIAFAAETTKTPLVSPERGENSAFQESIFNVARIKPGFGTGTASSNAVTINTASGIITTESLTTAAGSSVDLTLTSNKIQDGDAVVALVDRNSTTGGQPAVTSVQVSASTAVIRIKNTCLLSGVGDCSTAFNGALKVYFLVLTKGNPN